MLPSLRIKEDHSSGTKNSPIMPTLGAGPTVVYRKIAFQIPAYYNAETADQNDNRRIGFGLGYIQITFITFFRTFITFKKKEYFT